MSRDIIEAIDGALEDWMVSGDAMRWTPDPEPEPELSLPETLHVTRSSLRWVPSVADPSAPTVAELRQGVDLGMHLEYGGHSFTPPPVYWTITTYTDQFTQAMEAALEVLTRVDFAALERLVDRVQSRQRPGPRPLCVDGRAYRRRVRRRRR